jgi:hypothetical protein
MNAIMDRSRTRTTMLRRLDSLLTLPLGQFRRQLTRLTPDELAALENRISLQEVKQRWALGSHGVARHRAPGELARLARRQSETRREHATRLAASLPPVRLLEHDGNYSSEQTVISQLEEHAA